MKAESGLVNAGAADVGSDLGNRIIKVNHAGEHGAINIYTGQIFMARWTAPSMIDDLLRFRSHELRHRALFDAELARRGRPRCRSYGLCGFGGLMLGLVTGLFGAGAIAATTVAVEGVVLKHLQHQVEALCDIDPAAVAAIMAILDDEQQHHDESEGQLRPTAFWSMLLKPIVSASTEAVIWLGMRL